MNFDIQTLGYAMGSAWLSGINLYLTVLTLGVLERFHLVQLPGDLNYIGHNWVLVSAAMLAAVQFIADKIPAVDSAWDAVHTFIRVPAGAVLASAAFAHFDPQVRVLAFLLGGGLALSSHGTKAATRLTANMSPEPFSNLVLSILGDLIALGGTILMVISPTVIVIVVVLAVAASALLLRKIVRAFRRWFGARHPHTLAS